VCITTFELSFLILKPAALTSHTCSVPMGDLSPIGRCSSVTVKATISSRGSGSVTRSGQVFRDDRVAYASQMWAGRGICELHVWPGGFHASDIAAPVATRSQSMMETRTKWLSRILAPDVRSERLSSVTTAREGGK
jgi:hypothetical protein